MTVVQAQVSAPQGVLPAYKAGEVLVTLKSSVSAVRLSREMPGIAALKRVSRNLHKVQLQPDETVASMIERLKQNPLVAHVQPNYIKKIQTEDPYYTDQWGLNNSGQLVHDVNGGAAAGKAGADISAELAWEITRGERHVVVAVLDTGIEGGATSSHRDLAGNLWHNPDSREASPNGIDDDNNGCIDDVIGCDFSDINNITGNPVDLDGHGTMVAGVVAAVADNNLGVSGVSPGVSLMIVKAFDGTSSTTENVVAAIDYAIAMGADVINASYGAPGTPTPIPGAGFDFQEYYAIQRAEKAGVLFVVPAGNGAETCANSNCSSFEIRGFDNDTPPFDWSPYVPASYDLANIVAVAATDHNDRLATFSNFGVNAVDLAAPGYSIVSTSLTGVARSSGTSLAAPYVSGSLALMLSVPGSHDYVSLKQRLLSSVDPVDGLSGKVASGGRLNAAAALSAKAAPNPAGLSAADGGGAIGWFLFPWLGLVLLLRRTAR